MNNNNKRIDTASKIIRASPEDIYRSFLYPEAIASWRPPGGMRCHVYKFEPWQGGTFKMAFEYVTAHEVGGKTSENIDLCEGQFTTLVPNKKIVEAIKFASEDPAFAGTMSITTELTKVDNGTRVSVVCEDVPKGIKPEDHHKGMTQSLEQLAAFVE